MQRALELFFALEQLRLASFDLMVAIDRPLDCREEAKLDSQ